VRRAAYPPGWEEEEEPTTVDASWPDNTDNEVRISTDAIISPRSRLEMRRVGLWGACQRGGGSPNVTVLSREQSNALLPGSATGSQYSYYFGVRHLPAGAPTRGVVGSETEARVAVIQRRGTVRVSVSPPT
jgi:hypothetical protein